MDILKEMQSQKIGDTVRYQFEQELSFGLETEETICLVIKTGENRFSMVLEKRIVNPILDAFEVLADK